MSPRAEIGLKVRSRLTVPQDGQAHFARLTGTKTRGIDPHSVRPGRYLVWCRRQRPRPV
jgi:hypothetical protein